MEHAMNAHRHPLFSSRPARVVLALSLTGLFGCTDPPTSTGDADVAAAPSQRPPAQKRARTGFSSAGQRTIPA